MRNYPASPFEMFASIIKNYGLIKTSAKREVLLRYRGSIFGILWSFFNPLIMLLVYTFVFSEVFKAKWGSSSESKIEYALVLFAGLIVFNLFSECISRAPILIVSNVNYVKKVVYPLEILPIVGLVASFYHALIALLVWVVAHSLFIGLPSVKIFYFPIIIIPLCLFILGVSWILASLGVFIRDVSQFIGSVTTVLMFMSPIFYPAIALPEKYRNLLLLNPMTPIIEMTRDVMYWGNNPDFSILGYCWIASMAICWLGFSCFQKTRKGFADVL